MLCMRDSILLEAIILLSFRIVGGGGSGDSGGGGAISAGGGGVGDGGDWSFRNVGDDKDADNNVVWM